MVEKLNGLSMGVVLGVGLVLGVLLYMNSGDSIVQKDRAIGKLKADIRKLDEEIASAKAIINNKTKFQDELNFVSDRLKAALEYLPTDLNAQDILRQMYAEAKNSGVKLVSVKPKETTAEEFYEQISLEVKLEGGYPQLTLFLSFVSKLKRIIRIKKFQLSIKNTDDGSPLLSLLGELVAYRYVPPKTGDTAGAAGG